MENPKYFQDYMPGNICFGCGRDNHLGLQISSYWKGEQSICQWSSEEKYQGWKGIMNGGILATLIDCHCMGTAAAAAYRNEERDLGSFPEYRYATGTLNIKYLRPTSNLVPVRLITDIIEVRGRKVVMHCKVESAGNITVEADVIAIRVYDASDLKEDDFHQE